MGFKRKRTKARFARDPFEDRAGEGNPEPIVPQDLADDSNLSSLIDPASDPEKQYEGYQELDLRSEPKFAGTRDK
jgi:hypothetical protein